MKLVVGLGNPGSRYELTRHNIGFETVSYLAGKHGIQIARKEHQALTGFYFHGGEKILLAQPMTYMNNSGEAVEALVDYYDLLTEDIIVIYDDIDLDVGRVRIRKKGSAGTHNGMRSIISHLGTTEFPRVRIGIGARPDAWDLADYVLGKFTEEEKIKVRDGVIEAVRGIEMFIDFDIETAMNTVNRKVKDESNI